MHIYHHHTIHIASNGSGFPYHRENTLDLTQPRTAARSEFSLLGALGGLVRCIVETAVLHLMTANDHDDNGDHSEPETAAAAPSASTASTTDTAALASQSATDALRTLFSRAASRVEQDSKPVAETASDKADAPLSPLAAAFLAAFGDAPTLA